MPNPAEPSTRGVLFVGIATTTAIALLTLAGLSILSAVRAYVGGEGLWSKGQKDAVHHLHRYAESRDEEAYRAYRRAIDVPLGDRIAREELEKADPDFAIVKRGFLLGRNHPDDIWGMARLFRDFRRTPYMRRAIAIWERGDAEIAALAAAGSRLHRAIDEGAPAAQLAPILAEIDAVNARVTPLEDDFSFTLGEAARWAKSLVLAFVTGAALILFLGASLVVRRLVRAIAASEGRYRALTETASDGILSVDEQGKIVFANPAAARIFGHPVQALLGTGLDELLPERSPGGKGSFPDRWQVGKSASDLPAAVRLHARHRDGREVPLEISFGESSGGRHRTFTGVVRDVTVRREAEQEIERLAYHDTLTGLPNRALFNDRLGQALAHAHRQGERLAIMFIDLDDFKRINDSLGHTRGDAVLQEVGRRLRSCLRGEDTAARVGGDEFIVFLPETAEVPSVLRVAGKILNEIARPIELEGQSLFITASIGISLAPDDGLDRETLMRNADIAMYRAKEHGANTFEFFTDEMNQQMVARHDIEQGLYRAVGNGELSLHYQPIWRLADERIVAVEALLRWNHPDRGEILPSEFIAVAENSPVMLAVGDWVLEHACEQLRRWRADGVAVDRISINVAARQFQQKGLAQAIQRVLEKSDLSPRDVGLEITETAAMKNIDLTLRTLGELRRLGVAVLMDDFGSGSASIGYLRRFAVDVLKIDRQCIEALDSSPADAAIVRAIIEMAHGIGLSVVAEGVARPEQLNRLRTYGCDQFQGFLMSRPVPAEAIPALIAPPKP